MYKILLNFYCFLCEIDWFESTTETEQEWLDRQTGGW